MNLTIFKNLQGPQKISLFTASGLLLALALVYFAIFPIVNKIKNVRLEIINQKIELVNNRNKELDISHLNGKIQELEPKLESFNAMFVKQNRELEFITTLEAIAKSNNITQTISINPNKVSESDSINKNPISLEANGSFANLVNYLKDLEKSEYHINIRAITLDRLGRQSTGQENGGSENALKMVIQADTYWR